MESSASAGRVASAVLRRNSSARPIWTPPATAGMNSTEMECHWLPVIRLAGNRAFPYAVAGITSSGAGR